MQIIPITRGYFAKVDDADFERLNKLCWSAMLSHGKIYAKAYLGGGRIVGKFNLMHREVLGVTDPKIKVDHINHNGLDCQRHNLRPATNAQNVRNRKGLDSNNTSGARGVTRDSPRGKWVAQIHVDGKHKFLGRFESLDEAREAAIAGRKKYFGEFAGLG